MKKQKFVCPVCGQYKFESNGNYDICRVCFWENDELQNKDADLCGGANSLSLNDYKKWWNAIEEILPSLIKKYKIKISKKSHWKYDELILSRKYIYDFIQEMTNHNIKVRASFYYLCDKYKYDDMTFVGFPLINYQYSVNDNNQDVLNIIFSADPEAICKKYKMEQVLEILNSSTDKIKKWEELTPHLCIMPTPQHVPNI